MLVAKSFFGDAPWRPVEINMVPKIGHARNKLEKINLVWETIFTQRCDFTRIGWSRVDLR